MRFKKYEKRDRNFEMLLIARAQKGDIRARNQLIENHFGMVVRIAQKYWGHDYEDMFQVGVLGMIESIRTFKNERGILFSSWASRYIRMRISEYISRDNTISIPRYRIFRRIKENVSGEQFISLDEKRGSNIKTGHELIGDGENISKDIENRTTVEKLLAILNEDERDVIEKIYFDGMSLREVGKTRGCTYAWIAVIRDKAIAKMRGQMKWEEKKIEMLT